MCRGTGNLAKNTKKMGQVLEEEVEPKCFYVSLHANMNDSIENKTTDDAGEKNC